MTRSPEARAAWHQLYAELTAERPGLYGAVVGRGEAQTLRLSMLYALLDGVGMIDVRHLRAATAVWRYCDASARIIFAEGQAETADPLEQLLLIKVREQPGINRRGLHKAIGGHIPAKEMVQALARLRDRGQIRCEHVATGGRPSECWFPDVPQPKSPLVVPPATKPAEEPTKHTEQSPASTTAEAPAVAVATAEPAPPSTSQPPTMAKLTLPGLITAVDRIGGEFRRQGDAIVVEGATEVTTPEISAGLVEHQSMLLTLLASFPDDKTAFYEFAEFIDDVSS